MRKGLRIMVCFSLLAAALVLAQDASVDLAKNMADMALAIKKNLAAKPRSAGQTNIAFSTNYIVKDGATNKWVAFYREVSEVKSPKFDLFILLTNHDTGECRLLEIPFAATNVTGEWKVFK